MVVVNSSAGAQQKLISVAEVLVAFAVDSSAVAMVEPITHREPARTVVARASEAFFMGFS